MLRPLFSLFVGLSVITGLAYPALVTGIAQTAWSHQANGSVIAVDGRAVGSELIGQSFTAPGQFWGRPSATGDKPYNALASAGSNLGSNNPALIEAVRGRVQALRTADPTSTGPIPIDLLTASASGLDPEITLAGALWQVPRVARAHGLSPSRLRDAVRRLSQQPFLGVFGEPRVNVLALNLMLDGKAATPQP